MKILRRKTWLNRILGLQQGLPQTRSWYTFALFFFFFIGITTAQILFVFPFVEYPVWIILFSIFDTILLVLFLICWLKSPGALKNTGKDSMLVLLQKCDPQEICFDCVVRRPIRSKHCENCETCVSVFDHHCTWTNNCVGAKNHGFFLCLVITALLSLILLLLIEIIHYPKKVPFYLYTSDYTHLDIGTIVLVKNILTITCGFVAFMFILPLLVLNYIQLGNFLTGKTTNERFGTQTRHKESQALTRESADSEDYFEEKEESQLSKYLGNCWDMCFGNARNKRYGTQGAYYDDDILVLP